MLESKAKTENVSVLNGAGVVRPEVLDDVQNPAQDQAAPREKAPATPLQVVVVGTGYVGLVTGAILADQGNTVVCVDKDAAKLETINRGESPIYEPGLDRVISGNILNGRLTTTTDLATATQNADVLFIAVGTPPSADGTPDLTAVMQVVRSIAPNIKKHLTLVTKSTVPVGTGNLIEQTLHQLGVDPQLVDVVSNPEFLREGSAVHDTVNPDRVVIGVDRPGAEVKLMRLYGRYGCPILVTNRTSAELIKYASNAFLATKISFINAISRICEECGADVAQVAKGMGLDKRIGPDFLNAGLGWGGSCFPKDVAGLIRAGETFGYEFDLLTAAHKVNDEQTRHFTDRLAKRLGTFQDKRVALLGLAFKPNTDDIRDAKSLEIIDQLKQGGASIVAYDPVAAQNMAKVHPDLHYAQTPLECLEDADAVVIVTEWEEFKYLDLEAAAKLVKNRVIFDGRRVVRRADAERAGFEYFTIGA